MQRQPGLVKGVAYLPVELRVLLGLDLVPRPGPERGGLVDRLTVHLDRDRDVVGIGLDYRSQPCRLQELVLAFPQMEQDFGAVRLPFRLRDRELSPPVRFPGERFVGAGGARDDADLLRHHEG